MRIPQPKPGEPIRVITTPTGKHRYRVVLDTGTTPDGKRRQVTRTVDTLREARDFVTRTRADITSGDYIAPTADTLDALLDRWLASRRDIRPVTVEGYRDVLRPVRRHLGSAKVQDIGLREVDDLIDWLGREGGQRGQGLSPRTVRAALIALSQAMDLAQREGTISKNPARLAKRPRKARTPDTQRWTPEEMTRFRQTADQDPLAAAWRLTLCGLRRSEVLGMTWANVNLTDGVVSIVQGRVQVTASTTATDDPKSEQSRRDVPVESIHPGTVETLKGLRKAQASHPLLGLSYVESGLLVTDEAGRPMRPENYSDRFRRLCREAGVPVIRLHAVRHSLADRLAALGVAPVDAASLLGHSPEVFWATYARGSSAGLVSAAETLGKALAAES